MPSLDSLKVPVGVYRHRARVRARLEAPDFLIGHNPVVVFRGRDRKYAIFQVVQAEIDTESSDEDCTVYTALLPDAVALETVELGWYVKPVFLALVG